MKRSTPAALWRRLCRAVSGRGTARSIPRPPLDPGEGYRRWAASYDDPPTVFQQLEADIRCAWLEQPWLHDVNRVLDLGAGKGRASADILQGSTRWCAALDATLAMLVSGRQRGRRTEKRTGSRPVQPPAVVGDAIALPFRRHSFDLVIAALVFGHVADVRVAFAEASRVLRPGGSLIMTDFHPAATERGWLRTFEDPETGATESVVSHPHTLEGYLDAFEAAGLSLVEQAEPTWQGRPVVLALRGRLIAPR